jgi:hypothetical protein
MSTSEIDLTNPTQCTKEILGIMIKNPRLSETLTRIAKTNMLLMLEEVLHTCTQLTLDGIKCSITIKMDLLLTKEGKFLPFNTIKTSMIDMSQGRTNMVMQTIEIGNCGILFSQTKFLRIKMVKDTTMSGDFG